MLEVSLYHIARFCVFIIFSDLKRYFRDCKMENLKRIKEQSCQVIDYSSLIDDTNCVFVNSTDVKIISSKGDHTSGSSKVKMNNIVDYSWEEKYYTGQLIASHVGGNHIAYTLKGGKQNQSVIRVVNLSKSKRMMIKGINGHVEDMAFAFNMERVILASLDAYGAVLIHEIVEDSENTCRLLLHILGESTIENIPKRIFWCPFVGEDEVNKEPYEDELRHLLAVTRENKIELWNVAKVAKSHGPKPVVGQQVADGFLEIEVSSHLISDATFSPDGTAIATASYDGKCKFYQVYMHTEGEPRCLHEWEPHDGEPVTCLLFLDNLQNSHYHFWKYGVTGSQNNCELKLWSCVTWQCLQTITLTSGIPRAKLKAGIDISAGYIFLSNMTSRLMYVLELQKKTDEIQPFVQTITEFKLPNPVLSFAIVSAKVKHMKGSNLFPDEFNDDDGDESQTGVFIKMFLVQPKSLQECHIAFQTLNAIKQPPKLGKFQVPSLPEPPETIPSVPPSQPPQLNLMTPEAFHSPARESPTATRDCTSAAKSSLSETKKAFASNQGMKSKESTGSSPSREVEEILSSPRFYNQSTQQPSMPSYADLICSENKTAEKVQNSSDISALIALISQQNASIESLREEIKKRDATRSVEIENAVATALANKQIKCSLSKAALSEQMLPTLNKVIAESVQTEMDRQIKPMVKCALDEMKEILQKQISMKLGTSDLVLKESLSRLIQSRPFYDSLNNQLSVTAGNTMEHICKETFTKVAVPVFERACGNLFKQINDTFSKGLSQYIKEIESHAYKSNERMNTEIVAMENATEQMSLGAQKFMNLIEKETKRLEEAILDVSRNIKGSTLNNGSMRSGTVTPAPHLLDSQQLLSQIAQMIKQGDYNLAFQQALSASDLTLVTYVCEKVSPHLVFTANGGCILQQHILLSLIQQLTADMTNHSEIKYKYLEEAIMNLDASNVTTREHMPHILGGLLKQLQVYIAANPKGKFYRRAKMLTMATQSLLH